MELRPILAIVIPAYKTEFLEQTLRSIAAQTCKAFTLYIGDDASPNNIGTIVQQFAGIIQIVYKRFDDNLGAKNLVTHWNRCIDLVQDEEWIWFFSDDDLMDPTCVELFYEHIRANSNHALLHFNLQVIDEQNTPLYKSLKFKPYLSATDFFRDRLATKIHSCAVEYIFKKKHFEQVNRFEVFDLAWASDDATWIKLSVYNGIHTIDGAFVRWRHSTVNISSRSDSNAIHRKLNATVDYIIWAKQFFRLHQMEDVSTEMQKAGYPVRMLAHTRVLPVNQKLQLIAHIAKSLRVDGLRNRLVLFWAFLELKRKAKFLLSR